MFVCPLCVHAVCARRGCGVRPHSFLTLTSSQPGLSAPNAHLNDDSTLSTNPSTWRRCQEAHLQLLTPYARNIGNTDVNNTGVT